MFLKYSKSKIRYIFKNKRFKLSKKSVSQKSLNLTKNIKYWLKSNDINKIFLYYSIKNELNVMDITNTDRNYIFALPKISNDDMVFLKYDNKTVLSRNNYGIMEPSNKITVESDKKTLILIPSIALDMRGYRLGYGKGYYDKFIKNNKICIKMGIAMERFILNLLPNQKHDLKLNYIASEKKIRFVD